MKEFYKDFRTFVNESKNGTLNKRSERINEAITYTVSKDELKKFMVPATVKLISSLEAGKEMITAQSDNFEAYIVKVIDADTYELKPAMDVSKKKKTENVTPEREEGYEEEDDSTNDEELELEEMEDSEEEIEEDDDEPKFESSLYEGSLDPNIQKVVDVVQNAVNGGTSLMGMRKHFEKVFNKKDIDFTFSPQAHFIIKVKGKEILVVNKDYVDDADAIVGDYAIGYN